MASLKEIKNNQHHYFLDEYNQKQGEYKEFHADGTLWTQSFFVDNLRQGEAKAWHENGQLWAHYHYVDSEKHGEGKSWRRDGTQWVHGFYNNNNDKHGEYKEWHPDGSIMEHSVYVNGRSLDIHPAKLTRKDKFVLNLKYGDFPWL